MNASPLQPILYSVLPTAAMILAGALAVFRPPGKTLRSVVLHFAAGVVFAVVALELLPGVMHEHRALETLLGFAAGTGLMLGLRVLTRRLEARNSTVGQVALPLGLLAATGIDVLIDGLMIAIGFATGQKGGVLLSIALSIEAISLGFVTATEAKRDRRTTLALVAVLAVLFVAGAALGAFPLQGLSSHALAFVLSFGSAALLYLVIEELLQEAHEEPDTPLITATFFGGFLLLLLLDMIGG